MTILSVLDQSPICSGRSAADAINETIEMARATERYGYHRYWLAEHHATDTFAGSAPEIMVARVAEATSEIRVGSGGVMLSHYSPLKVAEVFRLLETMYPGRIDLGIGRAPGSDGLTAQALAYGSQVGIQYFPNRIGDLAALLTDQPMPTEAFAQVRATPKSPGLPQVWLLGSSDQSALYAAHFGIAFSFAHFINNHDGPDVLEIYRDKFQPSDLYPASAGSVCVFVVCAETEAEAENLAKSRDLFRIRVEVGQFLPYPSVEEAKSHDYSDNEVKRVARNREALVVGTPDQVKQSLVAIADEHGVEEVIILTICHDFAARLRSYELVAEAFGLEMRDV